MNFLENNYLSLIGLALSAYSIFQAGSAKKIATRTEKKIHDIIVTSDLSKVIARLEHAIAEIKLFGPSSSEERLLGVDKQKIADTIQDFALILNENLEQFSPTDKKIAQTTYETLMETLPDFSNPQSTFSDNKLNGSKILSSLSNLNSKLKRGLDKRKVKTN